MANDVSVVAGFWVYLSAEVGLQKLQKMSTKIRT